MSQRDEAKDVCRNPSPPPTTGRKGRLTNKLDYLLHAVTIPLSKEREAEPFQKPVDAVRLKLPDYYVIIKKPMDLRTIRRRLDNNYYENASECLNDYAIMFQNCHTYNKPGEVITQMAKVLERKFNQLLENMPTEEIDGENIMPTRKRTQILGETKSLGSPNKDVSPAKAGKFFGTDDQQIPLGVTEPQSRKGTAVAAPKTTTSSGVQSATHFTQDSSGEHVAVGLKKNKTPLKRPRSPQPVPSRKVDSIGEQEAVGLIKNKTPLKRPGSPQPGPSRKVSSHDTEKEYTDMPTGIGKQPVRHKRPTDNEQDATKKEYTNKPTEKGTQPVRHKRPADDVQGLLPPDDLEIYEQIFTHDKLEEMSQEMHNLPIEKFTQILIIVSTREPERIVEDENGLVYFDHAELSYPTLRDIEIYLDTLRSDTTTKPRRKAVTSETHKGDADTPTGNGKKSEGQKRPADAAQGTSVGTTTERKQGNWKTTNIMESSSSTDLDPTSDSSDSNDDTSKAVVHAPATKPCAAKCSPSETSYSSSGSSSSTSSSTSSPDSSDSSDNEN